MRRFGLVALAVVVLAPACAVSGLSFVTDDRVEILRPADNAAVELPFTMSWTAEDFDGSFAIFFDRSPMRPNQSLRALVADGDSCLVEPDCPNPQWLADRDIYVTDETRLEVDRLPDLRGSRRSKDRHDVTIVLLDEDGRRLGESAFTREFVVERAD